MIHIYSALAAIGIAFASACAGHFLAFCYAPGGIFRLWHTKVLEPLAASETWAWVAKPLGYCMYCQTGQIALWASVAVSVYTPLRWWIALAAVPISFVAAVAIYKLIRDDEDAPRPPQITLKRNR